MGLYCRCFVLPISHAQKETKKNKIRQKHEKMEMHMQIVLLVTALSVDVFVAAMACGAEHIRIEKKTALCISMICSGVLFLSLWAGNFLQDFLREESANWVCFWGLFIVGVCKLAGYGIKAYARRHSFFCKRIRFTISQIQFIFSIYNDPTAADKDRSASMSVSEGVFLALAMSVDGFFGGLGASFLGINIWLTGLLNFVLSYGAVWGGSCLGERLTKHCQMDFSWVGGVLFVCLAFSKVM